MPCLLLADGSALYDSRVIIEFLQDVAGGETLLPARGLARFQALTRATLADGIADAALLMVYEGRFRAAERALRALAGASARQGRARARRLRARAARPGKTDIVAIGLSCALGYLDWRKPVEWRAHHPALTAWLDDFARREPAFARTAPETMLNMTAAAPTWMAKPRKPALNLPPGACDAHVHVFGPGARFPYAEGRTRRRRAQGSAVRAARDGSASSAA